MTKTLTFVVLALMFGFSISTNAQVVTPTDLELEAEVTTTSTTTIGPIITPGSLQGTINVDRGNLSENGEVILIDSGSVNSSNELELYAQSILISDKNVRDIKFEDGDIKFRYKQTGKVLGLFTRSYDINVEVTDDGEISVVYPWYASLIRNSNKTTVRDRMENEIRNLLDRNSNASGEIEMNVRVMAEIASLMHTVLVEELNVNILLNEG